MLSLVTASTLLLASIFITAGGQRVNIAVYSLNKDDTTAETIRHFVSAANSDNRFVTANLLEYDCRVDSEEGCAKVEEGGTFLTITSPDILDVQTEKLFGKGSELDEGIRRLFAQYSSKFYRHRAEEIDHVKWWEYQLAVPEAKNLEQLNLVRKNSKVTTFVLYYKTEGYQNFAAFYAAGELFSSMSAEGIAVNCAKDETLCQRESLDSLPTLISYDKEGKEYKRYPHDFDAVLIRDWIKTIQQPVITKLTEDAVPYYREGGVPGFEEPRPSVIMFFAATRKSRVYKDYKRFARKHHGDYHLTELIDPGIEKWAHQPAFVAMKPLEIISKANTHYDDITYESMAEFIEENRHPSVHYLSNAQALHTVFSLNRPVLIFYDVMKRKNTTSFATLAANYPVTRSAAVFAINQGLSVAGLFLADMLEVDTSSSVYVLVDAKENCIYKKRITNEDEVQIKDWLETASNKGCTKATVDLKALTALRDWERRDELRRAVEQKLSLAKHEEL